MAIIYTPTQLVKGIRALFFQMLAAEDMSLLPLIATTINSEDRSEDYSWIDHAPQMSEVDGNELTFTGVTDAQYNLLNKRFRAGMRVSRDDLSDAQLNGIITRINQMAQVAARLPMKLLIQALIDGTSATVGLCIDGGAFFSASHPALGPGAAGYSNIVATTGVTTAIVKAQLQDVIELIGTYLNKNGEPANEDFRHLYIAAPFALRDPIKEAVNATVIANTSNVAFDDIRWDIHFSARLTAVDEYYVGVVDTPLKGLVFQDREPVEFVAQDQPTDDASFLREEYRYKTTARMVAGYGDPRRTVKVDAS